MQVTLILCATGCAWQVTENALTLSRGEVGTRTEVLPNGQVPHLLPSVAVCRPQKEVSLGNS